MTAERQPPAKLYRFAISVLLIGHLLAVILPPLSLQTRGPRGQSPSVAAMLAPVEGYSQFLYIDRGYAFFAPDPGPSHLVQAAITDSNGQRVEQMFPDRKDQWPRLLYHRHFMLTEFLQEIYQPPGPPPELAEIDPEEAELWYRMRARYEHVRASVVDHLQHEHPGHDVAIRRIEHLVPDVIEFGREPIELTDPRLYRVMLDQPIEFDATGDLTAPAGPPESIPSPTGAAAERDADTARTSEEKVGVKKQTDENPVSGEEADVTSDATDQAVESADADGDSS